MLEALLLGVLGSIAGASAGGAAVLIAGARGISLQVLETQVMLFPRLDLKAAAFAMIAASLGAVLASLWQARRASRLDPVVALRA